MHTRKGSECVRERETERENIKWTELYPRGGIELLKVGKDKG
jgi:hypothetical protein